MPIPLEEPSDYEYTSDSESSSKPLRAGSATPPDLISEKGSPQDFKRSTKVAMTNPPEETGRSDQHGHNMNRLPMFPSWRGVIIQHLEPSNLQGSTQISGAELETPPDSPGRSPPLSHKASPKRGFVKFSDNDEDEVTSVDDSSESSSDLQSSSLPGSPQSSGRIDSTHYRSPPMDTTTHDFTIEEIGSTASGNTGIEILRPDEVISNDSRSSHIDEVSDAMEREDEMQTYDYWKPLKRPRKQSSNSGSEDEGEALEADEYSSLRRRRRKKLRRSSLLFHDPSPTRIAELDEDSGSIAEIESTSSEKSQTSQFSPSPKEHTSIVTSKLPETGEQVPSSSNFAAYTSSSSVSENFVISSTVLDYVFFKVDSAESLYSKLPRIYKHNIQDAIPHQAEITVRTPSRGLMEGSLHGRPTLMRLPYVSSFSKLYPVTLLEPVAEGDCGSAVVDRTTNQVYGFIVAASIEAKVAFIASARDIVKDAEARLKSPTLDNTLYLNFLDSS
ncbi:hypothetical protein IL306_007194 [Fusarium sp. DS 682]|nr:hypothetical protein IL306_007194 [Fusarium sp. DS 682]